MNDPLEQFRVKPEQQPVAQIPEWNDENVFKHISEKTGRTIASWDDLNEKTQANEPTTFHFANEEVERINKYIQETGRSVSDFYESQKDWSKVDNKTLVMGDMREQYPTLTEDEIEEMYDEEYGLQEVDEDYDGEEEIAKVKKFNKRKEIKLKTEAEKVRQKMESLKSKYSAPSDVMQNNKKASEEWSNSMNAAISEIAYNTEDGFNYEFADKAKYDFLKDINSLLAPFKTKDGMLDYTKLAKTLIVGLEHDNVLKEYGKFIKANTVKDSMAAASNKSDPRNNPQQTEGDAEWKRIAMENLRNFNRKF
jgi:hypothetical protein